MRVWADVFSPQNAKIGVARNIISAAATRSMDGAGSISLTFSVTDQVTFDLLAKENRVRIYVEEDDQPRLLGRGVIRELNLDETNTRVVATGPDGLDALTRKSVLLNRTYDNLPISTIASSLTGLVSGWSADVTAIGNQSARLDGVNVLTALIRLAEEKGYHVRESLADNVVELGPFGEDTGLFALRPNSLTAELSERDDVLIINSIKRKSSSKKIVNWIIPLGAGEGSAAITLKDSSYTVASMVGPDGQLLYYLYDQESIDEYGQIEKVVTFKQIVPISNSVAGKEFAADALYEAGNAWLAKNSVPFDTYSISTKKSRQSIRPGEKITIRYTGFVETETGQFTYMDVNDLFWVNKLTESVNDGGITMNLEVTSVDRQRLDAEGTVGQLVSVMESMDVRNLNVAPFPFWFQDTNVEPIQGYGGDTINRRDAVFNLDLDDAVTNLVRVVIRWKTKPFYTLTAFDGYTAIYNDPTFSQIYQYRQSINYPQGISMFIDGIDVSATFGGPWNVGVNGALDVVCDITNIILAGNIYTSRTIMFRATEVYGNASVEVGPTWNDLVSQGFVVLTTRLLGTAQAIKPT